MGFVNFGVSTTAIEGKRIFLKPNLVEPHRQCEHINTHPLVIRGAAKAFLFLGASQVFVAEGDAMRRYLLSKSQS